MPAITLGAFIFQTVVGLVLSLAVSAIIGALFKPGKQRIEVGPLSSPLAAGGPKRVVFGRVGVRAVRLIANQRVDQAHHWVAALSDWPIDAIEGVMIRGEDVTLDADGWVTSAPWGEDGAQTIRFRFWDGTQTEPLADLIDAGLVEAGSIGLNTAIAWAEVRVPQSQDWVRLFQGAVPDFVFKLRGARVYDPTDGAQSATDPASWTWAREAILIQAFHQVCALGRARPASEIDWAQVAKILPRHRASVTSRRGDAGPRFAADGLWYCIDETHQSVEARIGAAHAGGLIDMAVDGDGGAGARQKFYSSDATASVAATVTEDDIGPEGATISDNATIDSKPNAFRMTFPSASRNYERYTLEVSDAAAIAEDGEVRATTVALDTVTSHAQAATLALLALRRERLGRTITGGFAPRLLPIRAEDRVAVVVADWQLTGAERWQVQSSGMSASDHAELTLGLDEAAWHADAGANEPEEIELADTNSLTGQLPDPTVTVISGAAAAVTVSGVVLPGIRVTVSGPVGLYRTALVSASYDNGTESDVQLSGTIALEGAASGSITLGPLVEDAVVAWRVEVQDNQSAPAVVTGTHTVSGDVTAPGIPSNLTLSSNPGSVRAEATAPADSDTVSLRFTPGGITAIAPGQRGNVSFNATPNTTVSVTVVAIDAAGNVGPVLGPVSITVAEASGGQ